MAGKKTQRVFALVLAVLFLVSSVGFTAMVIWQSTRKDKTVDSSNTTDKPSSALKGTQLADFKPVEGVKELQIIDLVEGTGAVAKEGSNITAHYTGGLAATGIIFESSHDGKGNPATFVLEKGGLIEGWVNGVPGMKVGGKRRLIIPYAQAYGAEGQSSIPAKADLVFDIELVSIN